MEKVKILWFNEYSGLRIVHKSVAIVFDPYQVLSAKLIPLNYILISHEHFDHFDLTLDVELSKYAQMILADFESGSRLKKYVQKDRLKMMKPGDVYKDKNVSVTALRSNHPAVNPLTYFVEYLGGPKIFYASDSLPLLEFSSIAEYGVDVAFVPIGIAPGSSPRTGSEIVQIVKPKVAIPVHGTRFEEFNSLVKVRSPNVSVKILPRDVEVEVEI
ncbi:MAG: MBL fold metallo-hydrolase [Nitrososphaeria archaeon]|nr:MBL fold metallo-hydrolase [Nitrososphaeria archaeon]